MTDPNMTDANVLEQEISDFHAGLDTELDATVAALAAEKLAKVVDRDRTLRMIDRLLSRVQQMKAAFNASTQDILNQMQMTMRKAEAAGADLYQQDIVKWAEQQAEALRRRALALDYENLAEEIEGVAANQKSAVRSRLRVICEHLLKWRYRHNHLARRGWLVTLIEQRRALQDLFEDSPSLRRFAGEVLQGSFVNAREDVERISGRSLRLPDDQCPWALELVLSPDFLPDPPDDGSQRAINSRRKKPGAPSIE